MHENLEKHIGSVCEIYTTDNDLLAFGRISDVRGEPSLTLEIVPTTGTDMPKVTLGTNVKINIIAMGKSSARGFLGICGRVYIVHNEFWRVDEIRLLGERERRGHFRVNNRSKAVAALAVDEGEAYDGWVTNVSLSGLLIYIDSDKCGFLLNSVLKVSNFSIGEGEGKFTVICKVRRIEKHPHAGRYFGCEFEDMSTNETDAIYRALFAQQMREIKRRRGLS